MKKKYSIPSLKGRKNSFVWQSKKKTINFRRTKTNKYGTWFFKGGCVYPRPKQRGCSLLDLDHQLCKKTYGSKTCCDVQAVIQLHGEVRPWSGGLAGQVEPGVHVSVQKHHQDNDQIIIEHFLTEKLDFFIFCIRSSVVSRPCRTSSIRIPCVCLGSFHHISDYEVDLM